VSNFLTVGFFTGQKLISLGFSGFVFEFLLEALLFIPARTQVTQTQSTY
jgi:hypothetical protein